MCVCACVHARPDTMMLKKHTEQMYRQIPYSPYTPGDIASVCFDPPNWTGVNQHHSSLRPRSVSAYMCNVFSVIIPVSDGGWLQGPLSVVSVLTDGSVAMYVHIWCLR